MASNERAVRIFAERGLVQDGYRDIRFNHITLVGDTWDIEVTATLNGQPQHVKCDVREDAGGNLHYGNVRNL